MLLYSSSALLLNTAANSATFWKQPRHLISRGIFVFAGNTTALMTRSLKARELATMAANKDVTIILKCRQYYI